MQKVTMSNFGLNIFKAKTQQNSVQAEQPSRATNPFGVSFKGSVIHADVFEKVSEVAQKETLRSKVANRGKLMVSALVGNINNFNDAMKSRMNSIVSFGKQIKQRTADAIHRIANTEVDFKAMGESIKNVFVNPYSVNNLSKRPVGELEQLLIEAIA
ncbi:hypothetical protein J6Q66_06495 [bacterium]|nr:hypothetical protein [bacterium]